MYIEDRLFSEASSEVLYSVLMDEEELSLYSDFMEERIFFQNAVTGEYYTGETLEKAARDLRSSSRVHGWSLSRGESIKRAYYDLNRGIGTKNVSSGTAGKLAKSMGMEYGKDWTDPDQVFKKAQEKGTNALKKRGMVEGESGLSILKKGKKTNASSKTAKNIFKKFFRR